MLFEGKDVTIRFGGLTANNQVNMQVDQGEIVGLIGPNGAGKSTFFKAICGINLPCEGSLLFDGTQVINLHPWEICKLGITCTFQLAETFPALTVLETVMVGAHCRYNSTAEAKAHARKIMDFVGITEFEHMKNNRLNLFTRKKVEICAALATSPKMLLLDEIFAGCTLSEDEEIVTLVKKINQEMQVTILLVEHVLKVVHALCNRVYVLEYGKIIATGTPGEVTQNALVINAYLGKEEEEDAPN